MSSRHRHTASVDSPSADRAPKSSYSESRGHARRRPNTANNEDLFLNIANDNSASSNVTPSRPSLTAADRKNSDSKNRNTAANASSRASLPAASAYRRSSTSSQGNGLTSPTKRNASSSIQLSDIDSTLHTPTAQTAVSSSKDLSARSLKDARTRAATATTTSTRFNSTTTPNGRSSLLQERLANQRRASNGEATSAAAAWRNTQIQHQRQQELISNQHYQSQITPTTSREQPDAHGVTTSGGGVRLPQTSRAQRAALNVSEDVESNASTVWDELGELKKRIRQLEDTKRTGLSVDTADTNERPLTGNTQTTGSTSPQRQPQPMMSPGSRVFQAYSELHPLLHSALEKARSCVDPDTYRALESSAADALDLAYLTRGFDGNDTQSVATSALTSDGRIERRLRRKADNMCRSLTELCIALCQRRLGGASALPHRTQSLAYNGRDYSMDPSGGEYSPLSYVDQRRMRVDELRPPSQRSRGSARLAPGRFSDSNAMVQSYADPQDDRNRYSMYSSIYSPSATDSPVEDREFGVHGYARRGSSPGHAAQQQFSREYTARHPLPDGQRSREAGSTSSPSVASTAKANNTAVQADFNGQNDDTMETIRPRRSLSKGTAAGRAPPSVGIGLAEKIEARRQARSVSVGPNISVSEAADVGAPDVPEKDAAGGKPASSGATSAAASSGGGASKDGDKHSSGGGFFSRLSGLGRRPGSSGKH